ncbi:MAG: DEAD/DEAH box helicase [Acidobacteriia bacterium]|nr:DEAD/DEAH box helicase [Terriglobia bacterium]
MPEPLEIELNPAQREIVERGLLTSGFSCVLQMPTGAGKTWLAEQAILATLRNGQRAVYITPLRALANELVEKWRQTFEEFEVGVFTGEYGQRQAYPVPFSRARLLVMTPERLDACTRHWRSHWGWLPDVGLLVVDELHLLGEARRGPRLEGAILRVRRLNPFLQILGLSATLGNRSELADWLAGVHYESDWRAIPVSWRCVRYERAADKPRILREQIERCIAGGGQSLVFVQSRRRAEDLALELAESGLAAGHHHAGLDSEDRRRLEHEYRSGGIRVLVSTGTLEMGLNLPARQVILYDLQSFDGNDFVPLSTNTVWQRAGRAGRRGLDTHGEAVLLAPSWDRSAERYARGRFDRVLSGLSDKHFLAEQVLAEVWSGLARTRSQLKRALQVSLAAHQNRLPSVDRIVDEMVEAGMMVEVNQDGLRNTPVLKETRLGRIAVRQMLTPSTVVSLAKAFGANPERPEPAFTFLDILLVCAQTDDCEPLIPVDFEELEDLGARLVREHSTLLSGAHPVVMERFQTRGRRLLAVIKTALIARQWTRTGDTDPVAKSFGCYAFEVRRLSESFGRLLSAATALAAPSGEKDASDDEYVRALLDEGPPLLERIKALASMIGNGLDEQTVTLTFIPGLGAKLARRLRDAGITDIEELALVESDELAKVRGLSRDRASRWVGEAANLIRRRSALTFREFSTKVQASVSTWPANIDQYRLRRALDLTVRRRSDCYLVSGGLEPHRVRMDSVKLSCDCADFAKGENCKHVLATSLKRRDPVVVSLVERLKTVATSSELDLFQLWFDGGRR